MTDLRRTPLRRLLMLSALMGGASLVEDTATGNPVVFSTEVAKPLVSLEVPFTPIQEGTGDPSPQNVRPIVPWNGLKVYHSGADTSDPIETDISFPSPVYGGEHEAVSGKLMDGWAVMSLAGKTWTHYRSSGHETYRISIEGADISYAVICNKYKGSKKTYISDIPDLGCSLINLGGSSGIAFVVRDDSFVADEQSFAESMADAVIAYHLATPQEITLTPQQITALVGDNTIWSDADGSLTAVYLKKA